MLARDCCGAAGRPVCPSDWPRRAGVRCLPGVAAFLSRYDGGKSGPATFASSRSRRALAARRDPAPRRRAQGSVAHRRAARPAVRTGRGVPGPRGGMAGGGAGRPQRRSCGQHVPALPARPGDRLAAAAGRRRDRAPPRRAARRDPGWPSTGWTGSSCYDRAGKLDEADGPCSRGCAAPARAGPALVMAAGAARRGPRRVARCSSGAIEDALGLEPLTARDDDARLDAAAITLVLAQRAGRPDVALAQARGTAGHGGVLDGRVLAGRGDPRAGGRPDASGGAGARGGRLAGARGCGYPAPARAGTLLTRWPGSLLKAREALDRGDFDEALRGARSAVLELAELGVAHALLAEVLNARRERGGIEAARRATESEPGPDRGVARARRWLPRATAGGQGRGGLPRAGAARSRPAGWGWPSWPRRSSSRGARARRWRAWKRGRAGRRRVLRERRSRRRAGRDEPARGGGRGLRPGAEHGARGPLGPAPGGAGARPRR